MGEVMNLIMEQAALRYDRCSVGEYDPITLQIKDALNSMAPTDEFNEELYKAIILKTYITADGSVQLVLKNRQII